MQFHLDIVNNSVMNGQVLMVKKATAQAGLHIANFFGATCD